MLYLILKAQTALRSFLFVLAVLLISEFLRTDYNSMGLLMIFWFYQYRNNKIVKMIGIAINNVFLMGYIQVNAVLALIPIALHNGEQGPKCKGFFYGYYTVHLLVLSFINMIL